jgi:cytochrome oxidase assembly protein ShyY1
VGSILVAVIVGGCIAAGFWQLRRLDERLATNDRVQARGEDVVELPRAGFAAEVDDDDLNYRRVRASGSYDGEHELLVRFRSRKGLPGYEVVTPLVMEDGILLVNRGWVPLDVGDRWPVPNPDLPSGRVEIEGVLVRAETAAPGVTPTDGTKPAVVSSVAPRKLASVVGADTRPVYALTMLASGSTGEYPEPVDPPSLGEGPHRDYAIQWFLFAAVGIIGWPLLLFRRGPFSRRTLRS